MRLGLEQRSPRRSPPAGAVGGRLDPDMRVGRSRLAPTSNVNYVSKLEALLKQAHPRLRVTHRLGFKNCFGAATGYVDGHIFISCGKFGVALRLPPAILAELFKEEDVSQWRHDLSIAREER